MKKNFIGEAAKIYGVSSACLRYWEKEGLIDFERDNGNNYRQISYSNAERIGNIVMFRKLAISVKELKENGYFTLEYFDRLLDKSELELCERLRDIETTINEVKQKRKILEKIRHLKSNPFTIEKRALKAVEPYYYYSQQSVRPFLRSPNRFAVIIKADNPTYAMYGFFKTDDIDSYDVLRPADKREHLYLKGLLRVGLDDMLDHNSMDFVEKAKELGYTPSDIVGRYLIALNDGKPYDFYEAWMRLEP